MNSTQTLQLTQSLIAQIGQYRKKDQDTCDDAAFVKKVLGSNTEKLHAGIAEYQAERLSKINKYVSDHPDQQLQAEIEDSQFFRKLLIKKLVEKDASSEGFYNPKGSVKKNLLRKTSPEKAAIKLEDFLGDDAELYRLALEEELHTETYRNAVLRDSTTHEAGKKWSVPLRLIVAGPSGSGKSVAAKAAVKKASQFLPTLSHDYSGNYIVAIDGGITRQVSQIRKLVIQVANNKGYTGIRDLHKQSRILEKMKRPLKKAVFSTKNIAAVIPVTFSNFSTKLFHDIYRSLPEAQVVFSHVIGDSNEFSTSVAYMGSRRAWKIKDFNKKLLDLNITDICESKNYGASGFAPGCLGSHVVKKWYMLNRNMNRTPFLMTITNDLLLRKQDPKNLEKLIPAAKDDKETVLVSKRIIAEWEQLPIAERKQALSLEKFNEKKRADLETLITTSIEVKLSEEIKKLNDYLNKSENKEKAVLFKELLKYLNDAIKPDNSIQKFIQIYKEIQSIQSKIKTNNNGNIDSNLNKLFRSIKSVSEDLLLEKRALTEYKNINRIQRMFSVHQKNIFDAIRKRKTTNVYTKGIEYQKIKYRYKHRQWSTGPGTQREKEQLDIIESAVKNKSWIAANAQLEQLKEQHAELDHTLLNESLKFFGDAISKLEKTIPGQQLTLLAALKKLHDEAMLNCKSKALDTQTTLILINVINKVNTVIDNPLINSSHLDQLIKACEALNSNTKISNPLKNQLLGVVRGLTLVSRTRLPNANRFFASTSPQTAALKKIETIADKMVRLNNSEIIFSRR